MGQLIDLFTKQVLASAGDDGDDPEFIDAMKKGTSAVEGTDDEQWFVENFFDRFLGEFDNCVYSLKEAGTITELEEAIRCVQEEVAKWPRA